MLATKLGAKAISVLEANEGGVMVGLESNKIVTHPLEYAWTGTKNTDLIADFELAKELAK